MNNRIKVGTVVFTMVTFIAVAVAGAITLGYFVPEAKYQKALKLENNGQYDEAIEIFSGLGGYKDCKKQKEIAQGNKKLANNEFTTGIRFLFNAGVNVDVNYDANGGTCRKEKDNIKKISDVVYAKKEHYEFDKWNVTNFKTSANNYDIDIDVKASFTGVKSKIILNYTYSSDYNYAYTQDENKHTVTVQYGEEYSFEEPKYDGYDFISWSYEDITITNNFTWLYEVPKNAYFKATWKKHLYSIRCILNGGEYQGSSDDFTIEIEYYGQYELPIPTREGYDFVRWVADGSYSYVNNTGMWLRTDVTSLTAEWRIK